VQQQLLSNELLQTLVGQSSGSQGVTGAVGMIGKTVEAANSNATITDGKAKWSYNLAGAASNATLTISDASGKAVWTGTAPDLSSGTHGFTWDGKTTDGTQLANGGTYSLSIAATNANGAAVAGKAVVSGVVTAATNVNGVVMLKIGDASAPLSSVTSVSAS
jgi:flagellar basal-body rod modification protein FlgD